MSIWNWIVSLLVKPTTPHGDHQEDPPVLPPIAIDHDGWMSGVGVSIIKSARSQRLATPGEIPEGLCAHWTATSSGTARALARRIAAAPAAGERSASWSAIIERDGSIIQSVSCKRGSWHAGGDTAAKFTRDPHGVWAIDPHGKCSANAWTFGVEMICVGEVRSVGGKWIGWPFASGAPAVSASEVVEHHGRHYQTITEAQEQNYSRILAALVREYALPRESASWGHAMIDPSRKIDPGPVFAEVQLPRIVAAVYGQ